VDTLRIGVTKHGTRRAQRQDRVPIDSETSATEIGDDEVSIPVTEVVEEDVRREEVDIEDQSERRNG
jgi:hypothetical protein